MLKKLNIQLYTLLIASIFITIAGFFIFPNGKWENAWFFYIATPLLIINYQQIQIKTLFYNPNIIAFVIFSGYLLLNTFVLSNSFFKTIETLRTIFYILIFYMMLFFIYELPQKQIKIITNLLVSIATISAIISMVIWYQAHPLNERLWGDFFLNHPILSDWGYGAPLIFCLYQAITNENKKHVIGYMFQSLPLLLYILLTQSRGPLLALLGAMIFIIFTTKNKRAFLCLALIIVMGLVDIPMLLRGDITLIFRLEIWQQVIKQSMNNFWFGHGYMISKHVLTHDMAFGHAHNVFIEMFYLGGMVGVLLMAYLIYPALKSYWAKRHNKTVNILASIFIFGLLCMMTDGSKIILHPHALWLSFWLPYWMLNIIYLKTKWQTKTDAKIPTVSAIKPAGIA